MPLSHLLQDLRTNSRHYIYCTVHACSPGFVNIFAFVNISPCLCRLYACSLGFVNISPHPMYCIRLQSWFCEHFCIREHIYQHICTLYTLAVLGFEHSRIHGHFLPSYVPYLFRMAFSVHVVCCHYTMFTTHLYREHSFIC